MVSQSRNWLIAFLLTAWAIDSHADIRLPKIFADHMVLQRGPSVAIWGTAEPQESLTLTLGDQTATTQANAEGQWRAEIQPPLGPGPFKLEIKGDQTQVVFQDVLIGEVWICAGQLNMISSIDQLAEVDRASLDSAIRDIRLFTISESPTDHPKSDFANAASWQANTPEAVNRFSAIGYLFGQNLATDLNVPVGLINATTLHGTCESWVPWEALAQSNQVERLLQEWTANPKDRLSVNRPGNLYNAYIHPLTPLNIRGVVWWQGESDVGRDAIFRNTFPLLIDSWRKRFRQPEMPFLFVQLTPHRYANQAPEDLPKIWDIQRRILRKPFTGLAITSDLGPVADLKAAPKSRIARRLARIALDRAYGRQQEGIAGPRVKGLVRDGARLRINLEFADGLHSKSGQPISGFSVCGADQNYVEAQAELLDGSIEVWAEAVPQPVAVRYAWSDTAVPTIFNKSDLPLLPFSAAEIDEIEPTDR